jgi:hypothetical protein
MTPDIGGYYIIVARQSWYHPSPPLMGGPDPVNKYQRSTLSPHLIEKSTLFHFQKSHLVLLVSMRDM